MPKNWIFGAVRRLGPDLDDEEYESVVIICCLIKDYRGDWPLDFEISGFIKAKQQERSRLARMALKGEVRE